MNLNQVNSSLTLGSLFVGSGGFLLGGLLPNVFFVLAGIVWSTQLSGQ